MEMRWSRAWRRLLRRNRWDAERAQEIDSYLEIETAENIARGMAPVEAAFAARRRLGNSQQIREEIYRMNSIEWLETVWQDVRYGARLLRNNPGFTAVAVASLALGIGANTAIFELVDAVRLRSLPVKSPQELAEIRIVGGNHGLGLNREYGELTRPMFEEIRRNHPAFSGVLAWTKDEFTIGEGAELQLVNGLTVSGSFFEVLGIEPWRGRLFTSEEEHACPESTAVVSHAYWQGQMASRPIDASTKLLVNGEIKQVLGVTAPSFSGLVVGSRFDVAVPFCEPKTWSRNSFEITVLGRLRPGWTLAATSGQLTAQSAGIMAATEVTGYTAKAVQSYRNFRLAAYPGGSGVSNLRNQYDSSLWLLLAITGLVLLIACANLANLMLARASSREREVAVRLAVGAARSRLLRQLLIESALLAAIGAVLGIGLAQILSRLLVRALATSDGTVNLPISLDWRVLLFTGAVAALTCVVFGMAPAFRATRVDPINTMKAGGRGMTAGRDRFAMQRVMVVTQISVSLVLVAGALLFVRSFNNLMNFDPGLREKGVTIALANFRKSQIAPDQSEEFKRRLLGEVASVPGVLKAATTTTVPLIGWSWSHNVHVGSAEGGSRFAWASPSYFDTMNIPVLSGRNFSERDTGSSQRVAIVNQTFVRTYLKGANPLGAILRTDAEPGYPSTIYEIVGTIADTKYNDVRGDIPPMAFAPASQNPSPGPWGAFLIDSDQPPATIIREVKNRIASDHPEIILQFHVFETQIHDGMIRERLLALLSGLFGGLAALLAMVGLYGVISYTVARRRNEIGIRVALGARRNQVLGMVMREAALLLAIGILFGAGFSLILGRGISTLLFGLQAYDPLTLAAAACLLILIGAGASFLPAQRASALDPMTALRYD